MKNNNYFRKTVSYFKTFRTKKSETFVENELIHPRFGSNTAAIKQEKNKNSCLTFLMYSKENENLFI